MANYADPYEALLAEEIARANPNAARTALTTAGGFAPGAGILEAAGYYPGAEGGYAPSLVENLRQGNYGTAGLQGLGAAGDLMLATGMLAPVGMAMKGAATAGKAAPELAKVIEASKAAGRTPVVPAPNRWFAQADKFPFVQNMLEKTLEKTGKAREEFSSGAYLDPRTGDVLDTRIMSDAVVAVNPATGKPMMSGVLEDASASLSGTGSRTLSNLVRKSLFKPLEKGTLLDDVDFIVTIEKSNAGHLYGLSTEYKTPVELYNTQKGANPTLRPKSKGDVYGVGSVVGNVKIGKKEHPVYEKLMVVPKGEQVEGAKYLGAAAPFMLAGQEEQETSLDNELMNNELLKD
jgi:hypothetical protein